MADAFVFSFLRQNLLAINIRAPRTQFVLSRSNIAALVTTSHHAHLVIQ